MSKDLTKNTYENPQVIKGYIKTHALNPKLHILLEKFSKHINGKQVLDLGCGPGHDSYKFAELGFDVTGVDYSSEMIKQAKILKSIGNNPNFIVGDMRELKKLFPKNHFDAAWISASLIHIEKNDVSKVLVGLKNVLKNKSIIYIGIKGGKQEMKIVKEKKYGKKLHRKFMFWEKDNFTKLLKENGFEILKVSENKNGTTGKQPTNWINYFAKLNKQ